MQSEILWAARYGSLFETHQSTKQLNFVADGCIWMSDFALAKVSVYFQRLEICMQIQSVNFRKFTRTWFATQVFIFRPPETLLCELAWQRESKMILNPIKMQKTCFVGFFECHVGSNHDKNTYIFFFKESNLQGTISSNSTTSYIVNCNFTLTNMTVSI